MTWPWWGFSPSAGAGPIDANASAAARVVWRIVMVVSFVFGHTPGFGVVAHPPGKASGERVNENIVDRSSITRGDPSFILERGNELDLIELLRSVLTGRCPSVCGRPVFRRPLFERPDLIGDF